MEDVFIVGLGPSMKMFDQRILDGKPCCLLNDGWRHFPELASMERSLTVSCALRHVRGCEMKYQIIKGRKKWSQKRSIVAQHDNHIRWDDPKYYTFSFYMLQFEHIDSTDPAVLWTDPDYYWRGQTVASYAIQFLVNCGVRSITMVGCDCADLGGDDYFSDVDMQRLKMRNRAERQKLKKKYTSHDYPKYLETLEILRRSAWESFQIPIMSLTPFVGVSEYDRQYKEMLEWRTK